MTDLRAAHLTYPPAQRDDIVDDLHGRQVADPYRWLEDPDDPRTAEWSAAQDELAAARLDAVPGRDAAAERLHSLLSAGSVSAPVWRCGRAFFTRREPGQEFATLHVRESDGTERVLLDVTELDPSGLTTLDSWSPSLEGDRLAYQISVGGDEESLLHVMDVATGDAVEGPIDRCRYSTISWLPGGSEFFYVRRLPAAEIPDGEEQFHRRVWRHRVGSDPDRDDVRVLGDGLDHTYYYGTTVSRDGRWLIVEGSPGTARRDSVWIADLSASGELPELRQIVDTTDGYRVGAWVDRDGRLYVLTTLNAPRWRLCVADPRSPEPENWTELIGEDEDSVLEAVRWFDPGTPRLAVLRTRHAVSELALHDPATGRADSAVELPGTGQVTALTTVDEGTTGGRDRLWIGWTDFATPPCVHAYSHTERRTDLVDRAPGATELPQVRTRQVTYRSADGTPVRMFLLTPADGPDRPRPAFLTGYGGFSLSREPGYAPTALAWVAAGGVWALPALRGGGEEGEQWHEAGMRERKQNTFDDFHAAARHLIDEGWTTPEQLAISGGSNGGLLVGAALTQRPELYRAVVCSAPLLDMVRYEHFLLGRTWNDEYGTAEDPVELDWLLSYSPYHNVHPGTPYPSVLFTVFESDTRVDPNHARKMCAALQEATSSDPAERPILLRRETEVGHAARSVSRTVGLSADQLAFLAQATGLALE
ncbi:S9 family peptidase [Saccharopolyspora sp. HNM0983]|uniref:prolyl oligopeptidase n=1 Tax=Saccharopolyspora montiporae TaxID=2781240 RepID=A0A929B753_9PSEU|nr:S9 family peptidase [Saccharopolyspora sp. HNM0983]